MKIVYFSNGTRGEICLKTLLKEHFEVLAVVLHPRAQGGTLDMAMKAKIPVFSPEDPNAEDFVEEMSGLNADVFVLAGYGKILRSPLINTPKRMTINLHGGALPQYRGSSPMNWVLINGERKFSISIIKVDSGVDTGDILDEKSFVITDRDNIRDLHRLANEAYPQMLVKILGQIGLGTFSLRKQEPSLAAYYPLRFPGDGLIIWDMYSAQEIHNRVRALTDPYPCAFTYAHGKKVLLVESQLTSSPFYGEPGRIYRKTQQGILICASDCSLWITKAVVAQTKENAFDFIQRYDVLLTVKQSVVKEYLKDENRPI